MMVDPPRFTRGSRLRPTRTSARMPALNPSRRPQANSFLVKRKWSDQQLVTARPAWNQAASIGHVVNATGRRGQIERFISSGEMVGNGGAPRRIYQSTAGIVFARCRTLKRLPTSSTPPLAKIFDDGRNAAFVHSG